MSAFAGSTLLLTLAWFAAVNAAASLASWVLAVIVLRSRYRERSGLLLGVRLLPAAASLVFVVTMFVPSHWRFEPDNARETFGLVLSALACVGAAMLGRSLWRAGAVVRAGRALLRSQAHVRGVSLVGIWRTRILVGAGVRSELTTDELEAALAHERAHRIAHDNIKRFLIICAPDLFGRTRAARRLEKQWHAATETLADARAAGGDERRALHLASALVKVARLAGESPAAISSPAWSMLHDQPLLETRVRRLVAAAAPAAEQPAVGRALVVSAAAAMGLVAASAVLAADLHYLTEALVHWLP